MQINLAVYTAQEGYSWQPGTVFSAEELGEFKKCIGKFPSPDASDFPFGGIFLSGDRVVFYRYHVAKKIDFRGRDALYCVLGAVQRDDAARIDPAALFASPEFAGPMKPFPTALELAASEASIVPEWLKNLDKMTLDVRITGTADNPSYAVVQEPIEIPKPPAPEPPTPESPVPDVSTPPPPAGTSDSAGPVPAPDGRAASHLAADKSDIDSSTTTPDGENTRRVRPLPRWMIWLAASLAVFALLLAVAAMLWIMFFSKTVAKNGRAGVPPPSVATETVAKNGRAGVPPPSAATETVAKTGSDGVPPPPAATDPVAVATVDGGTPTLPECQDKDSKAQ